MFARLYNWLQQTEVYSSLFKKQTPPFRIEGTCKMTGSCCQNLILVNRGQPVRSREGFAALVRRKPYHRMFVPLEEPDSEGRLRFSCSNLTEEHRCGIYDQRPDICRRYPESHMITLGGKLLPGCGFTIVLAKNFEQFLDENLVKIGKDKR